MESAFVARGEMREYYEGEMRWLAMFTSCHFVLFQCKFRTRRRGEGEEDDEQ